MMDNIPTRNNLQIGIYSPYFHILGGGEQYLLTIAELLSKRHNVTIYAHPDILEKAKSTFNISLERVQILPEQKYRVQKLNDVLFYMTDGSLFFSFFRRNFLIIQSPSHIPAPTVLNRLKLYNWKIICYSQFMHDIIEKRLNISPIILPPAIDTEQFKPDLSHKKNIILSVGRFFSNLHNKRHDFLIEVFKKNSQKVFKGWKLVIAGGLTDKEGKKIVLDLKKQGKSFPIEIFTNISFENLRSLYREAKIYWHATGYQANMELHPERAEHFGITTLEAMASGCVPLVFAAGGQKDIVDDGINGFLWNEENELIQKSKEVITDRLLFNSLSQSAIKRSQDFSLQSFYEKLNQIIAK